MSPEKLLPTVTMTINLCAAVAYACKGDFARVVYWVCAGMLTATVTWWMR